MNGKSKGLAIKSLAMVFCMMLICMGLFGCGKSAPDALTLQQSAYMLGGVGETYDLSADVVITGGEADAKLTYTSSDLAVAEVSDDGVIKAAGFGSAVITVASADDESISETIDVFVYGYRGVYSAVKYIDAMGCDVRVRLCLNDDGSYSYYRYPMYVNLDGGGSMPELTDSGVYVVEGNTIQFSAGGLGEYSMDFQLGADGQASLQGSVPTGGAATQIQLLQNSTEDRGESGVYTGAAETENKDTISYQLTLDNGKYTLVGTVQETEEVISSGTYSFEADRIEFSAREGVSFGADYDADRAVVEGTEIPVSGSEAADAIAATLSKSN